MGQSIGTVLSPTEGKSFLASSCDSCAATVRQKLKQARRQQVHV